MPECLAIIDCGTNTFNLLIVEILDEGKFRKIYSTRASVKLGEGAINQGYISEMPFNRGLTALESFSADMARFPVNKVLAYATSAIRDASNGEDFVRLVNERYGISISIIDGNREAELIASGVMAAVTALPGRSLVMDIGGGSTEFIITEGQKPLWKHSFNIGAARLLDRFKPSNPMTKDEFRSIQDYLRLKLEPLLTEHAGLPCAELLGSSGAFDSIVEMIHGELNGEALRQGQNEYLIRLDDYRIISERVRYSTLEERRHIKGLVAMRIDMIVISCILVDFVLESLNLKRMRVSTYSLKEGAVVEYIRDKSPNFKTV
ncbi:MAG TPA: exopolyphosphatase [Bacteroidia bacterium]|nr:exopolyphosphatase [Bacteroidia bacterium]